MTAVIDVLAVPLLAVAALVAGIALSRPAQAAALPATKAPPEPGQQHPRGIRNNNPGNIRTRGTRNGLGGSDPWEGLVGEDDDGYGIFSSPVFGIRAMFRLLKSYAAAGKRTIREIISRWAPPAENDTAAYIADVSKRLALAPDLELSQPELTALVKAIIRHENGVQPYSHALIEQARALA